MTHVIDLMSTRTSADFCVEGKKIKRSCHHSGPHRLPLGAGLWPAGRGLHMPALVKPDVKLTNHTLHLHVLTSLHDGKNLSPRSIHPVDAHSG